MASYNTLRSLVIIALTISLAVQDTLAAGGGIECEYLNEETCSLAVSSTGKRCVLEKQVKRTGQEAYTCKTSEIEADKIKDHIETEQCVKSCGLDRKTLGISSDSLLETHFTKKLCSPECYQSCPNVVDLYFNLAAGEGVFLPKLCESQGANARRGMSELKSSGGIVAHGPFHSGGQFSASPPQSLAEEAVVAPTISPAYWF